MATHYKEVPPLDSHEQGKAQCKEDQIHRLTASNIGKVYKISPKTLPKSRVEKCNNQS